MKSAAPLLFLAATLLARPLAAETPVQTPPPGGAPLVPPDVLVQNSVKLVGKEYGKMETVAAAGVPFKKALRVTTTTKPVKEYGIQTKLPEIGAIKKGDAILASFYARSTAGGNNDTGAGQIEFGIQVKDWPYPLAKFHANPGPEWKRFYLPMKAAGDAAPGEAHLAFSYGAQVQTIEVGGLELFDYGTKLDLKALPITHFDYAGREPDAAWRRAADERIEKLRKADLIVTVKGADGRPLPAATVNVRMKRHAFEWGATLNNRAFEGTPFAANILKYHKEFFNMGVAEGSSAWFNLEIPKQKEADDKTFAYLAENHQAARMHVILYERMNEFPPDVQKMVENKEADKLRPRIEAHITDVIKSYKDRGVSEFVVENEAVDNHELRQFYGPTVMADWFKLARQAGPNVRLMINENRTDGGKPDKTDAFLGLCHQITSNGGPLDVLGIQGHMGTFPIPPVKLLEHYDRLASTTGKALAITEYDFGSDDDPQLKADYTRDIMTVVFSHPSFNNFTIWKWWDGGEQRHHAVLFAYDWTLKPSGQAYKDLVFKKWWTNADGQTDASGQYKTRGFLGDYEVTATAGGKTGTVKATLRKGTAPNTVEITLGGS